MFRNMKVRTRIRFAFGVVLALMACMIGSSVFIMAGIEQNLATIVNINNVRADAVGHMDETVREIQIQLRNLIIDKDAGTRQEYKKIIAEMRAKYDEHFRKVESITDASDTKGKELLAKIKAALEAARPINNRMVDLALAGNIAEAAHIMNAEARPAISVLTQNIDALADHQGLLSKQRYEDAQSAYARAMTVMIGLGGIALVLSFLVSYWLAKGIVGPLQQGVSLAEKISAGDLTAPDIEVKSTDEIGSLSTTLNAMKNSLTCTIGRCCYTSTHVATASEGLSSTVTRVRQRAAEQSERATQVAAASTQMAQTVIDIAKNASDIAMSSHDTLQSAKNGKDVVSQTVAEVQEIARTVKSLAQVMGSLGDRSKQIGQIVDVIKDIADQTNLLALNAAIEAARAGEQGRGFAVVADEVRKLAEKTSSSTAEIGGMINAIQEEASRAVASMEEGSRKVETGVSLALQAGGALEHIVTSVNALQSQVQQIASATEEMSSVSEQISSDIDVVATVSQETSESSHRIAQEADNLSRVSLELNTEVSRFKVDGNGNSGGNGNGNAYGNAKRAIYSPAGFVHATN